MYSIAHSFKNTLNHHHYRHFKELFHITHGIFCTNLRFHGTLHWRGVNSPNDLRIMCSHIINDAKKILDCTFSRQNPSAVELLCSIDHVSNMLCLLADPAEFVRTVHPEPQWRIAANEVVNEVSMFIEKVNMDKHSYAVLINAINETESLTFEQQKVLYHMIASMRDHGVHFTQSQKSEYLALLLQERELSQILTDTQRKYIKIPTSLIPPNYMNQNDFKYKELLLDYSLGNHLMKYTHDTNMRKQIYCCLMQRSQTLDQSLLNLTQTRHKMAKMRQFSSYSSLSLRDNILSTPAQVDKYLTNILDSINSSLVDELHLISANVNEINPWDLDYLVSQYEIKHISDERFTFNSLMDFFRKIVKSLFDIQIVESQDKGSWDELMKYHFVKDGIKLCTLYLDIFNRDEKNGIFAQFTLKCSKSLSTYLNNHELGTSLIDKYFDLTDGQHITFQTPSTAIVCNFPRDSSETNLDINQAIMLFHELGHTLHTLLSLTTYQHLSGNRGGVDFAEFSSHLFEFYPRKILNTNNSNNLQCIELAKMAILALSDQIVYSNEWHDYTHLTSTVRDKLLQYPTLNQSVKGNLVLDIIGLPNLSKFDHLVHYGGTYYCYLYSRSLAGMIWKLTAEGNEYSAAFGQQLYKFFSQGSIDSSIKPILDICNGNSDLLKHPESINPKFTFM